MRNHDDMNVAFRIRPATLGDARLLFEWRNDPQTRENSRSSEELQWETHVSWLTNVLSDTASTRHLYIVENEEGTPIGTVRYDESEDGYAEISYTVAPEWRGQGIGAAMTVQFAKEFLADKKIKAVIKKGHIASEAVAHALGLTPKEEESSEGTPDEVPLVVWK